MTAASRPAGHEDRPAGNHRAAPRVLLAVDKFKGCLRGREVAAHLREGILAALPNARVRMHPVSDGGDGFADELTAHGFTQHRVAARDALGRPIVSSFAFGRGTAVVEMAQASGLQLIAPQERLPLQADTFGLGMVLQAASLLGPDRIVVGAGGSATNDGGAGVLAALGARLFREDGSELTTYGPAALTQVHRADLSGLSRWRGLDIQVATDVTNPLLGPSGAAAIFGPQKGAGPAQVQLIESALLNWADALEAPGTESGRDRPGAGAAGGLGFGLCAGLGAEVVDGLNTFAALSGLAEAVAWADVVITGEGSLDSQTTSGKAPSGVLRYATGARRPCWVVAGRSELTDEHVRALGYRGQRTLMDLAPDEQESLAQAPRWLRQVGAGLAVEFTGAAPRPQPLSAPPSAEA